MITYHYNGKRIDLVLNGEDNPSCPNCKRYNAMLFERMCNGPSDDYVLKCRDCRAEVIVLTTESSEQSLWLLPTADGAALKALGYSDSDVSEMMPQFERPAGCSSMFIHGVDCGCDDEPEDTRPADWTERTI